MADQASHVLYAILRGEQYEDEEDVPNQPAMSPTVETDNEDIDEEIEEDEDDTIFDIEEKSSDDDDEEGEEEEEEDDDEDDNVDKPSTSEMKSAATNKENRMARQCVICGKRVIYLAHHIARQHRVKDKGRRMRLLYQSRQIDPIRRSKEPQYKRRPRDCIVPGCHAKMLIRLDNHLVAVHKLKRGSPIFSRILMETRIKYDDVDEKPEKMSINESYSVFDRAGQHLLLIAGGGSSAKKTVYNHVLQMKKISEMAGGVKELFTNSSRLRNCHFVTQHAGTLVCLEEYLLNAVVHQLHSGNQIYCKYLSAIKTIQYHYLHASKQFLEKF